MDTASRQEVEYILKVALNGEQARGDNGAVLVDTETQDVVYLLTHEFKPSNFSEQLEELLSEDGRANIFVVHKTKDSFHVSKIPRGI